MNKRYYFMKRDEKGIKEEKFIESVNLIEEKIFKYLEDSKKFYISTKDNFT